MLRTLGAAGRDERTAHRTRRLQLILVGAIALTAVATLGGLLR